MKKNTIYTKIMIATVLSIICALGLIYLFITNGTEKITAALNNKDHSSSSVVPVVTDDPNADPAPTPTTTPEIIDDGDDITSDDSIYRYVSKDYPLDPEYEPQNLVLPDVPMYEKQYLIPEAASALEQMFSAAKQDGINLKLVSGYRSYKFQTDLYDLYTRQKGKAYADSIDAYPGASEHQLGLAVDLAGLYDACELKFCFDTGDAYRWLKDHSYLYGYILRYPKDKENITGIVFSPWAFRYIGKETALKIYNSSLTIEEYYDIG